MGDWFSSFRLCSSRCSTDGISQPFRGERGRYTRRHRSYLPPVCLRLILDLRNTTRHVVESQKLLFKGESLSVYYEPFFDTIIIPCYAIPMNYGFVILLINAVIPLRPLVSLKLRNRWPNVVRSCHKFTLMDCYIAFFSDSTLSKWLTLNKLTLLLNHKR